MARRPRKKPKGRQQEIRFCKTCQKTTLQEHGNAIWVCLSCFEDAKK